MVAYGDHHSARGTLITSITGCADLRPDRGAIPALGARRHGGRDMTVIHQPRVAWDGARAFVRAAGSAHYEL
jgi:hypothetical protein